MKKINEKELAETPDHALLSRFPRKEYGFSRDELRTKKANLLAGDAQTIEEALKNDRQRRKELDQKFNLKRRHEEALKTIEMLEEQTEAVIQLQSSVSTHRIEKKQVSGHSEATVVMVASDWHIEEMVDPLTVSNLNEHNLTIGKQRAERFFQHGLRLTEILSKDVKVTTIVLALLGDFFTNDIHDELVELAEVKPINAAIEAMNAIASGIEFLLKNSKYDLVIPCHSGNHARTTKTTRFATEEGHSLEFFIYHILADRFRNEPRVKFLIPQGYHSYVDIYDYTVRFHHGHMVKYGGGVGGIFIPAYKAISQWNKGKHADLDVFGHFHQMKDGGNFICNGSNIGYNAYALSIKADYEKPKQVLFLIDSKRGKTAVWPIITG